ncbi:unnamed protein product [Ilex paraguariensis]|uniref:tRNA(adenine(34)) deaminase n=1 Tax=Ilex paraguariensis TaxID=185542 RepID=A0ABC8S201_9AQUA
MHNIYISSTLTLGCKESLSFSINEYSNCLNDRFDRHPLPLSSCSSSCCACCANSTYRVPTCPSSLYGLRQSTLIHWSPCKRLILGGVDRCYTRFPVCDIDPNCYEKSYSFKKRSVCGRKGRWGKGRYGCVIFEGKSERDHLTDVDEAEVLLSLLSEEVGEECFGVRRRNGRLSRRVQVEKKEHGSCSRNKVKNADSGVLESTSKLDYELQVDKRGNGGGTCYIAKKKIEDSGDLKSNLKCEYVPVMHKSREEDKGWKEDRREEEKEHFLRVENQKATVRKEGSSCSSYYSFSSLGERESDNEIEGKHEGYVEESSSGHRRNSKRNGEITCDEKVAVELERYGDYAEEHGFALKRKNTPLGLYAASSGVECDWRKKSEKKLAEVSSEETRPLKESSQKQSGFFEVHASGSHRRNNSREGRSNMAVKIEERPRPHYSETGDQITGQFETRRNYKQFKEVSEIHDNAVETTSGSLKRYSSRNEDLAVSVNSLQDSRGEHHKTAGRSTRQGEYGRNSRQRADVMESQEINIRGTTASQRRSESAINKPEKTSTRIISLVDDKEEQHHRVGQAVTRQIDSRMNSQERYSTTGMKSAEETKEGPNITDEKVLQIGSREEAQKSSEVLSFHLGLSQETSSCQASPKSNIQPRVQPISVVEGDKISSQVIMMPPSSQLVARDQLHIKVSEFATQEVSSGNLENASISLHGRAQEISPVLQHENNGEIHGEPLNFINQADSLGSADRFQQSSVHLVDEFVEKVRQEVSTSEIQKEQKTYETKLVYNDDQCKQNELTQYASGDYQPKDHESRRSSQSSGTKGPSDDMWDVTDPSIQEPTKTEVPEGTTTKAANIVVKRSGRSWWNIITDVVRLQWASHSETHSSALKSGGRSSSNKSTSSEAWFSGHDPDENNGENVKSGGRSMSQNPTTDQLQLGRIQTQSLEVSSSSSSKDKRKYVGVDSLSSSSILESGFASEGISLPSSKEIFGKNSEEVSGTEGADGEVRRRKLQRNNQVLKNRFDEWEEAYKLEAEQRTVDEMFMREALLEAKKAADSWEVPVGAVLVQNGKIIARGCNLVEELRDSTAHAEMICIREASNILQTWRLSATTLYVTLEPCPMCAGAILQARIDTVVWGAPNKLLGADGSWIRLFPSGDGGNGSELTEKSAAPVHPFHPNITIRRGVLASECADAMQQFFQLRRKRDKKPEPPSPPSCLPISNHHSKFFTKMHDAFHMMFCL